MSEKDIFNTPEEEVKRLANEINEIKGVLGDLSRTLARIETRVKRAFPSAYPKTSASISRKKPQPMTGKPTLTPKQAIALYDELVSQAVKENINRVRDRLVSIGLPDLNLMRQETGISLGKKKPTQKTLIDAILARINESMKLSHHVNRKQLIAGAHSSEDPQAEGKE